MQVFIACGFDSGLAEDPFRKPKAGMWYIMEKHFNSGITIDMDQWVSLSFSTLGCISYHSSAKIWSVGTGDLCNSPFETPYRSFYVGDAAGRINDHSDADIKFAQVC